MARRLAAILFADLAGSTQLAHTDEPTALALLRELQRLAHDTLSDHHGRLVKSTGDGFLAEFPNALDAVEAAVDFQRRAFEHSTSPEQPPLRVRIGIHVGDVESDGTDILGDAVNIAARIEPIAEAGGICLSGPAYDQVSNKVPYTLEKLGPKSLKGVARSVDVYRVTLPWTAPRGLPPADGHPRLAVLPLANLSSDPENEYFADGMTEELITLLSKLSSLRVIARTSVMPYKTAPKPIAQIGEELGVTWVLEGSVRKWADRLRITVQLIDARSQEHTWAETYDRRLEDVFAIQTEVATRIAETLKLQVTRSEGERLEDRPTADPNSYLAYLKGRSLIQQHYHTDEALREARRQFELAISMDSRNARAYSGLADVLRFRMWRGDGIVPRQELDRQSRDYAMRALQEDPNLAEAHNSLGIALWDAFDYAGAERELRAAIVLNPSYADAHRHLSYILMDRGLPDEALTELGIAEELDPRSLGIKESRLNLLAWLQRPGEARQVAERIRAVSPDSWVYQEALAMCCLAERDFARTLELADRALPETPESERTIWYRPICYAATGQRSRAEESLEDMRRTNDRMLHGPMLPVYLHVLWGEFDEAYAALFRAVENREGFAFQVCRLYRSPEFDAFRNDPRFRELLEKMNLA